MPALFRGELLTFTALLFGARCGAALLSVVSTVLLARLLSPADLGQVMSLLSMCLILSMGITLNLESGAVRHLAAADAMGDNGQAAGFLRFSTRLALAMTLPVMLFFLGLLVLAGPVAIMDQPVAILFSALLLPALAIARATARQAGALGHVARGSLPLMLARPLALLAGLSVVSGLGGTISVSFVMGFFLTGTITTVAVQRYLLSTRFKQIRAQAADYSRWRCWMQTGFQMTPSLLFQDLLRDLILLLAALSLSSGALGLLAVVLTLVSLPGFALVAIEMAFAPHIARAIACGDQHQIAVLLVQSAAFRLLVALVFILPLMLFPEMLLGLFADSYRTGAPALYWLTMLPLARVCFGNPALVLNAGGATPEIQHVTLTWLVIMACSVPVSGAFLGTAGAAAAAGLAFTGMMAELYRVGRTKLGIDTSLLLLLGANRASAAANITLSGTSNRSNRAV